MKLTLQKMTIGQKRALLVNKQVDMAIYDFRPFIPDVGYQIYWNWLPDSLNNYWGMRTPRPGLGNEAITMAANHPERLGTLRLSGDYQRGRGHDSPLERVRYGRHARPCAGVCLVSGRGRLSRQDASREACQPREMRGSISPHADLRCPGDISAAAVGEGAADAYH